ncbi:unnamed protein product [Effrenium voratum]|nr:unnamed protein product [Effrenium voratum]
MPATVAVKLLEPAKVHGEAGYWGKAASIYAKDFFHVEADKESKVAAVKSRICRHLGFEQQMQLILFGRELDDEWLGAWGLEARKSSFSSCSPLKPLEALQPLKAR